jgi:hypothetical protein
MLLQGNYAESKIFVVGLHRAGTQSLHVLFESAGLKAIHWPAQHDGVDYQAMAVGRETEAAHIADMLAPVIAAHDALSDVPICALYESLAAIYPDAAFLALTRPAEDWVRSIRRHTGTRALDPYERMIFWRYLPGRPDSLADISDDALIDMHRRHYEGLRSFFAGSPRFKLLELYDPLAGEVTCDFLGLPRRQLGHVDQVEGGHPILRQGVRLARAALQRLGASRPE